MRDSTAAFPGFSALETVHAGARSMVYRAVRTADDMPVILKVAAGATAVEQALAQLRVEAAVITEIDSERVGSALDVAEIGGRAVLVLRDLGGESLDRYLRRARFSVADTLRVIAGVVSALCHVHAAGIVHRDVNPRNIVYDPVTATVRLIDFGIASRWCAGDRGGPSPQGLEGTPSYLAPEQTGRTNRAADARVDLYAVGVTLFEMLTGRLPFTGADMLAIVHAHLALRPPAVTDLAPDVPPVIAAIVTKLLAKAPEDRYQTANGLLADLRTCLAHLDERGAIPPMELGTEDATTTLEIPTVLYGRDAERAALRGAFERVAGGATEVVLLAGHSGAGKTSLVRELVPVIAGRRGVFVRGKLEQLRGDTPYAALVSVLRDLADHLLAESEETLAGWREKILAAIAPNARLVTDAVPALERILGPQPPLVPLEGTAAQRRAILTFQQLLQVFTRRAHPLVLFIDDMQRADPESTAILRMLAISGETESLLFIAAFRNDETGTEQMVRLASKNLAGACRVTRLDLAPLSTDDLAKMLAATVRRDVASVTPLAEVIGRKTAGNPFFAHQLLRALYDAGQLTYDHGTRGFVFDLAAIASAPITDNVADLLAVKLRGLPEASQAVLAFGAAIGSHFDIDLLARISGFDALELSRLLAPAIEHELIVPASEHEYITGAGGGGLGFRRLRFQHDRIQRAAYTLTPEEAQQRLHLRIGEIMLASLTSPESDERIFEVVAHLNRAASLIEDPVKQSELARLDVIAARRARAAGAHGTAIECLGIAAERFTWAHEYREQYEAHVMLAECCYLGGEIARALAVLDAASAHAHTDRDRALLDAQRATLYFHTNEMTAALQAARRASALLGEHLPEATEQLAPALQATIGEILARIGDRPIASLIDLPAMTDPDALALMMLHMNSIPAAYQTDPLLVALISARMVLRSLVHGNCPASARGYATLACVLHGGELHALSYPFGKLGFDLITRLDDRALQPSVEFVFGALSAPWAHPLEVSIGHMRSVVVHGREVGDHIHAGTAAALGLSYRLMHGAEPFADLAREARGLLQHCRELGDEVNGRLLAIQCERLAALVGAAEPSPSVPYVPAPNEKANLSLWYGRLLAQSDTHRVRGDLGAALASATEASTIADYMPGQIFVPEQRFHHAMLAAETARADVPERATLLAVVDSALRELQRIALWCPDNFAPWATLVEAERASFENDLAATLALYDQAIALAARYGWRRVEALANARLGGFWSERGKSELAVVYLQRARTLYSTLGAYGEVRSLEITYPALATAAHARASGSFTAKTASEALDVTTIAKATRAISGELERESLLSRMLDLIFENAGAESGALVLGTAQGLTVAAARSAGVGTGTMAGTALRDAPLPRAVVNYVDRTGTVVVMDDANNDPRFASDAYIRARGVRSVLCMPIKHKDRGTGVLYLENSLIVGAFTQGRLEALTILLSQLAVSLENAALFAEQRVHLDEISHANQELARHREHLEVLVAERTQALTLANQQLRDAAAERERIEGELRLAQKLESVGRLAAGIAHEINTPVQFVSDNIAFLREAVPGVFDILAAYRTLAESLEAKQAYEPPLASVRALEAETDVEYVLGSAQTALATATEGLDRVGAIVRAMKQFAHPDRNEKMHVDLNQAISSTLMMAASECKLIADIETKLDAIPRVLCHGGEINQVVLNLVVNAAHAIGDVVSGNGGRGKITVRTRQVAGDVEISITDTGNGIPVAVRDKIFEPFFTTKEVGRGTGQGLSVAHIIVVEKHGGSIWFETEHGVGTTFFVRIPLGVAMNTAA